MKVILTTSMNFSKWREVFRIKGIKAGQIPGRASTLKGRRTFKRVKAILTFDEASSFTGSAATTEKKKVYVTFRKELRKVRVDYDDDVEAISRGCLNDWVKTFATVKEMPCGFYGSYVEGTRPEEIIRIQIE